MRDMPTPLVRVLLLAACAIFALPGSVSAQEINLRNANLYLEHDDVRVQKPGISLELLRVYNSRSNYRGHFGYGWTTNLDIRCQEGPDGSVLVSDSDGFILRYTPQGEPRERLMMRYVDRLVEARKEQDSRLGTSRNPAWYDSFRQQLIDQPELRQQLGQTMASTWVDAAPGNYVSFDRGTERLQKKPDGSYVRHRADGTVYTFDDRGLLRSMVDAGGRGLRLDYDRDRRLSKVTHTEGGSFSMTWSSDQRVTSVLDTEGRRIEYQYSGDDLKQVSGPDGRRRAYDYDSEHNLVSMIDSANNAFQVSYDVTRDWVNGVKVGDAITRYAWEVQDPEHYTAVVTAPNGEVTQHIYDDAEMRLKVITPDGNVTETLLSACCAKPLEVRERGQVTRYDYDRQARLVGITYPDGRKVRYTYHPKWSKIVEAMHSSGGRFAYTYDGVGNLTQAGDGAGRKLSLDYGKNGKVDRIKDQDGGVYNFVYDVSGRPTRISRQRGGTLAIHYGVNGEIRSTEVVEGDSSSEEIYAKLREVLLMLEPATGTMQ